MPRRSRRLKAGPLERPVTSRPACLRLISLRPGGFTIAGAARQPPEEMFNLEIYFTFVYSSS